MRYRYAPGLGWLADPSIGDQVKAAVYETQCQRHVGAIELAGFAILAFTSAFGISLAIMRDDHRNPLNPL
jgi:hypothetical protein